MILAVDIGNTNVTCGVYDGEMNWDDCNKIVTGGFGGLISPHLKTEHNYLPNLTLDGIRIIYENN